MLVWVLEGCVPSGKRDSLESEAQRGDHGSEEGQRGDELRREHRQILILAISKLAPGDTTSAVNVEAACASRADPTAVGGAAWRVNGVGTGTPAADNVWEVFAAHVDVGAIDEIAIANVSVAAPHGSILLVWANDHVTVTGNSYDVVPVLGRVSRRLTACSTLCHEICSVIGARLCRGAARGCLLVVVEAHTLLEAGAPVVIVVLAEGSRVTQTDVERSTLILHCVHVAASQCVVNVRTRD